MRWPYRPVPSARPLLLAAGLALGALAGRPAPAWARPVTLPTVGWTIDIKGPGAWKVTTGADGDALTTTGAMSALTVAAGDGACEARFAAKVKEHARGALGVRARPPVIPATWYPLVLTLKLPATFSTLSWTCRELAGGRALLVESASVMGLGEEAALDAWAQPALAALEAHARGGGRAPASPPPVDVEATLARLDAILDRERTAPARLAVPALGGSVDATVMWRAEGDVLVRGDGASDVEQLAFAVHATDLDCASGGATLAPRERAIPRPAWVAAGYHATVPYLEVPAPDRELAWALCADLPGGVLRVDVRLAPPSAQVIAPSDDTARIVARALELARAAGRVRPAAPVTLPPLPRPVVVPAAAGAWRLEPGDTRLAGGAAVWPRGTTETLTLERTTICGKGEPAAFLPPGWRLTSTFVKDGRARHEVCVPVDLPGEPPIDPDDPPEALMFIEDTLEVNLETPAPLAPARAAAIRALLGAIGEAAGLPAAPASAPAAPAVATAATPSTEAPAARVAPPPAITARAPRARRSSGPGLLARLSGDLELSGHQLAPAADGLEDSYGATLRLDVAIARAHDAIVRPYLHGAVGYDARSELLVDAGVAGEVRLRGLGLRALVGVDGVGVGREAAADRITVPAAVYAGVELRVSLGRLALAGAVLQRASDEIAREVRLELRQFYTGRPIGLRYTSFADLGRFLALTVDL